MLEGLTGIYWNRLAGAYGPATDVPNLIRNLAADDPATRQRALGRLYETIWPQGKANQAALYTVPFLIELLDQPNVPDKDALALFLAHMAAAGGELDTRHTRPVHHWPATTINAIEQGTPVYLKLLNDQAKPARIAAPYLLAALPTQAEFSVRALAKRLEEATDPRVLASVLLALGALATPSPAALKQLEDLVATHESALVRIAAAGALVLLARETTPHAVAAVLAEAIATPDPNVVALYAALPWSKSGLVGDLAATLAWLGPQAGGFAVPLLCRALAALDLRAESAVAAPGTPAADANDATVALNITSTLLHLSYGRTSRSTPLIVSRLNDHQRATLMTIAQCDTIWRYSGKAAELLGAYYLPNTRAALRQSLQLPIS